MTSQSGYEYLTDLITSQSSYEDLLGPPRESIAIFHVPTRQTIDARVVRLTGHMAFEYIKKRWWTNLGVGPEVYQNEEDFDWDWKMEARRVAKNPDFGCYAAMTTADGITEIQGAIIYDLRSQSPGPDPKPAVYGKFLATAPRNRESVVGEARAMYRGVGEGLLLLALMDSVYEGYHGRMYLQSLDRAIDFYQRRGFQETIDTRDGTVYYKIGEGAAKDLLKSRGLDLWRP